MNANAYIKRINIGSLELKHNLLLAPLAGASTYAFRKMAVKFGAYLTFTEMISINAWVHNNEKTRKLLETDGSEYPLGIQLMGYDEDRFVRVIEDLSAYSTVLIDLNFGCPVKKVVKSGGGAVLLNDPDKMYKIIKASRQATSGPLTAKIRVGWEHNNYLKEISLAVEEGGADGVTVHGRTALQKYAGEVDYEAIKTVKGMLTIPVIGNGNIFDAASAKRMFDLTGVDGIMIARGAMGHPWIFAEILNELGGTPHYDLSRIDKPEILREHYYFARKQLPVNLALYGMRKTVLWYLQKEEEYFDLMKALIRAETFDEVDRIFISHDLKPTTEKT